MLLKIHGVAVFLSAKDSVLICATIVLLSYDVMALPGDGAN